MPACGVIDAGAGWFETADSPKPGRVVATFRRAVYLRFGEQILAVGSAIPAGPLHLRTPLFSSVPWVVGAHASLGGGQFLTGELRVNLVECLRWSPAAIDPTALSQQSRRFRPSHIPGFAPADQRPPWGIGIPPGVLARAAQAVARGDLALAGTTLGGLGPGLTPSGDDMFAGVLIVDALMRPDNETRRKAAAAVACAQTNDVAAAFVRWAAAGQSIQPVHDLLAAIASDDHAAQDAAAGTLASIGASSGLAILQGIELALR